MVVALVAPSGTVTVVPGREIYPNAPAVLVAIEVRHPEAAELDAGQLSELKRLLAYQFPLPQPITGSMITHVPPADPVVTERQMPRFATRDLTTAVTFNNQAVVVETTNHRSFEHLCGLLSVAVQARQSVAPVDGLMRLGLRYIDEVRVPDLTEGASSWSEWVDDSLLGPIPRASDLGLVPEEWQGLTVFDRGNGRKLILRYGPREGFAIAPGGLLQRSVPSPGPFFLLDIDSFWAPTGEVPEFSEDAIIRICEELHAPVSGLFELLITDRLRNEVLRHD